MLTVLTGCWGNAYSDAYITRMWRMVDRWMAQPHEFRCVTHANRPGWWGKVEQWERRGPALWLDIDTVITGPLDDLCRPLSGADIRTAKNWAQSGHGGCQSSVMFWEDARHISARFLEEYVTWPPDNSNGKLWGDQEFLTMLRDAGDIRVEYFDLAHVVSYKYHSQKCVPQDARVVCFHGRPKPHECGGWVKECWG